MNIFASCLRRFTQSGKPNVDGLFKNKSVFCDRMLISRASNSSVSTSVEKQPVTKKQSFASLLRNSPFIQMGVHKNVPVVGKIIQIQDDNLFIDFGGKFHSVCSKPRFNIKTPHKYKRGDHVLVVLHQFELSARFLGAVQDTTLLEADCHLWGLYKTERESENRLRVGDKSSPFEETKIEEVADVASDVDDEIDYSFGDDMYIEPLEGIEGDTNETPLNSNTVKTFDNVNDHKDK